MKPIKSCQTLCIPLVVGGNFTADWNPSSINLEELKHAPWIMKNNHRLHLVEMEQSPRDYTDPLPKTV